MKIEKSINKACFLRFLGSVSRKIGVFFGDFFLFFVFCFIFSVENCEAGVPESSSPY